MKRGPKSLKTVGKTSATNCQRKFPDEEGTKVPVIQMNCVASACQRKFPDEEGTEKYEIGPPIPDKLHVRGSSPMKRGPKSDKTPSWLTQEGSQRKFPDEEGTKAGIWSISQRRCTVRGSSPMKRGPKNLSARSF